MPISDMAAVPAIVAEVYRLQPERMIELGIGFGKYGALCREALDAMYGRCRPDQWRREISGVEGFAGYRNPAWDCYTRWEVRDFTDPAPAGWPLVLMVDALEHLEPERGREFLAGLVAHNAHVIVSVPLGRMDQGPTFGNDFECHRTTYHGPELLAYPGARQLHRGMCLAVSIPGAS